MFFVAMGNVELGVRDLRNVPIVQHRSLNASNWFEGSA